MTSGTREFDLEPSATINVGERPFRILALSGGGYRGLFTAAILQHLEEQYGRPLNQAFDLVAGTSIGGILAIAVAAGVSMATTREAFEKNGQSIFEKHVVSGPYKLPKMRFGALRSRYDADGLRATIESVLADCGQASLSSDVPTRLMIPAVNSTNKKQAIFRNYRSDQPARTLVDLALATSAAPTYFPEHRVGTMNYVDGGLIANAPDLLAINDALKYGYATHDIQVLSIGTIEKLDSRGARPPGSAGFIKDAKPLFELTLGAQQAMVIQECKELLGQNRYLRIDAMASEKQMKDLALDKADPEATDTLLALAETTVTEQIPERSDFLRTIFS